MKIDGYIEDLKDVPRRLTDLIRRILQAVNGGIEFGSPSVGTVNINGVWATGTTPNVADQEFNISHNMGRVPVGFLTFSIDQAGSIYKGATAWTSQKIYLKCHQISVNYTIFIC